MKVLGSMNAGHFSRAISYEHRSRQFQSVGSHASGAEGWLNRDLLLELRRKRKVYGHWKQGQVTREDYRDAVHHCREKICAAKAQLEFKLASTVKDNKKGFFKYVNSKRRIRDNIGPLLDEVGHLTNRDIDKAETLNAFFASIFNTDDGPWDPRSPVLEHRDWGDDKLPADPEVV